MLESYKWIGIGNLFAVLINRNQLPRDRDQDRWEGNCAQQLGGGWWYYGGTRAHLTGMHTKTRSQRFGNVQIFYYLGGERGNTWDSWAGAEMLLLPN